jgi:hypothetical protein
LKDLDIIGIYQKKIDKETLSHPCSLVLSETGYCENRKFRLLTTLFAVQIGYLEQWPALEEESTSTVAEAIEALQARTLCLPITSGAQVCGEQNTCLISCYLILTYEESCFYLDILTLYCTNRLMELQLGML